LIGLTTKEPTEPITSIVEASCSYLSKIPINEWQHLQPHLVIIQEFDKASYELVKQLICAKKTSDIDIA
jgi:hypothetical protein